MSSLDQSGNKTFTKKPISANHQSLHESHFLAAILERAIGGIVSSAVTYEFASMEALQQFSDQKIWTCRFCQIVKTFFKVNLPGSI